MPGKQFTDLTKASALKDSDIIAVHDGNGLKQSNMEDVTAYMSDKFSNPNLLINPDFKINQRGQKRYEVTGIQYVVDRWMFSGGNVAVSESGGITILSSDSAGSWFTQKLEKELEGIATLSIKVSNINGRISLSSPSNNLFITSPGVYSITLSDITEFNMFLDPNTSVTIEWTKLEKGSIATPFVAPNPAEELIKCQRYYAKTVGELRAYSNAGTSFGVTVNLPTKMRTKPTVNINNIYSYNVSSIDTEIKNDNSAIFVYGTAKNQDSTVVYCVVMCDAEIY